MTHTEIAFANERAIIADMLTNLLTNVRLTYLPDLEPGEAQELLLTGAHILIAQLGSQPPTAAEISSVIGRPLDVVTQRLDELIARGYVEHRANRYEMTAKLNVPNLQRQVRSNAFAPLLGDKRTCRRLGQTDEFDPELTFVRKPSLRHTYLPERVVRPFTLLEKSRIFGRIHFCL